MMDGSCTETLEGELVAVAAFAVSVLFGGTVMAVVASAMVKRQDTSFFTLFLILISSIPNYNDNCCLA